MSGGFGFVIEEGEWARLPSNCLVSPGHQVTYYRCKDRLFLVCPEQFKEAYRQLGVLADDPVFPGGVFVYWPGARPDLGLVSNMPNVRRLGLPPPPLTPPDPLEHTFYAVAPYRDGLMWLGLLPNASGWQVLKSARFRAGYPTFMAASTFDLSHLSIQKQGDLFISVASPLRRELRTPDAWLFDQHRIQTHGNSTFGIPNPSSFNIQLGRFVIDNSGTSPTAVNVDYHESVQTIEMPLLGEGVGRFDYWTPRLNDPNDPNSGWVEPTDELVETGAVAEQRLWRATLGGRALAYANGEAHYWLSVRFWVDAPLGRALSEEEFYSCLTFGLVPPNTWTAYCRDDPDDPSNNYAWQTVDDKTYGAAGVIDPSKPAVWNYRVHKSDPLPEPFTRRWHIVCDSEGVILSSIINSAPFVHYGEMVHVGFNGSVARMAGLGAFANDTGFTLAPSVSYLNLSAGDITHHDLRSEFAFVKSELLVERPELAGGVEVYTNRMVAPEPLDGRVFVSQRLTIERKVGSDVLFGARDFSYWLEPDDTVSIITTGEKASSPTAATVLGAVVTR